MSDIASLAARLPSRSMGLKLLLVCALALVMSIPALSVLTVLMDRTHQANQASDDVSQLLGGEQTFLGPTLVVPYQIPPQKKDDTATSGVYVIFPQAGDATAKSAIEIRQRSLFRVPVYKTDLDLKATFDLTDAPANAPEHAVLDWSRAQIVVGASDLRGAQSDMLVSSGGKALAMAPAVALSDGSAQPDNSLKLAAFSAAGLAQPGGRFDVEARLNFSGAKRLAVLPYGKTTRLHMTSDWPSPSFDGGFAPRSKTIDAKGFSADWTVPFVARGVAGEGGKELVAHLDPMALGVTFADPANPYQSVGRALKYAVLFVGLVFLAYFLFETQTGRRVHPAQYVLIGLAQLIFYFLLLSIAEQIGFDGAFAIAAAATVALISAYAGWVFESRRQGLVALGAFSALYGMIYVLMRLEDFALLAGAVASFAAIAAVMYVTRRLDWYGVRPPAVRSEPA